MHIMQHLWQYVERTVLIQGRRVYGSENSWAGELHPLSGWTHSVHPKSGLLLEPKENSA